MNRPFTAAVTLTLAALSSACGTGAPLGGSKAGAAQALYQAMRPASESGGYGGFGSPIENVSAQVTVKGKASGTATVKADVVVDQSGGSSQVAVRSTITYADYSNDGKTRYNGTLTLDLKVSSTGSSAEVKYVAKGTLTLSGEIDDNLDIDTSIEVSASALSASSGSASVRISGSISTRSGRYDYAAEAFDIAVTDELPAADVRSR